MLEIFKKLVESTDIRDENAAHYVLEELSKQNKKIELDKTYWVSEWSWYPIYDGIFSYEEHIRSSKSNDGVTAFYTNKNYRTYFYWDIYETKEECNEVCSLKNSFGYDWDTAVRKFIDRYDLRVHHISVGYVESMWPLKELTINKAVEDCGVFKGAVTDSPGKSKFKKRNFGYSDIIRQSISDSLQNYK